MIKNIQATFRSFKSFTLPNPEHNIWVRYFTVDTSSKENSFLDNQLNGHYSNFNFHDIRPKAILVESNVIQVNPEESLVVLLHLDSPISSHYFKFCKLLLQSNYNQTTREKIVDFASVQLMRAFIAWKYQFEKELPNILSGNFSTFFDENILLDSSLIQVLLCTKGDTLKSFLFLMKSLLDILIKYSKQKTPLSEITINLFNIFLNFVLETYANFEEIKPILAFLLKIFANFQDYDDKFCLLSEFIIRNVWIMQYFDDDIYDDLINTVKNVFERITSMNADEKYLSLGFTMMNLIKAVSYIKLKPINIAPSIMIFIQWSSQFEEHPEIEPINVQSTLDFSDFVEEKYKFIDENLSDLSLLKGINFKIISISPIYFQNYPLLLKIFNSLSHICLKDNFILEEIIVLFSTQDSIFYIYILVSIIFFCNFNTVSQIIQKNNLWEFFINPKIINDEIFKGTCDSYLINLANLILSVLSNIDYDDKGERLNYFFRLLTPENVYTVNNITNYFTFLLSPDNYFASNFINTNIMDLLIQDYKLYKFYLLENGEKENEKDVLDMMKKAKSSIVNFFSILVQNKNTNNFIYGDEKRIDFFISLFFEKETKDIAADIITRGLLGENIELILKQIEKLIYIGFENNNNEKWKSLIFCIIDMVSVSLGNNKKNLINAFIDMGFINLFSRIINAFKDNDSIINRIINFFSLLCTKSKKFKEEISNPKWNFLSNFEQFLSSTNINYQTLQLLENFCVNNTTLYILEGIQLLFYATKQDHLREDILKFLVEMTKTSVINRYQCFRANIIVGLLDIIENTGSEIALKLFTLIGSSFLGLRELTLTFRLLSKTENEISLKLLKALLNMNDFRYQNYPSSFFHLTSGSIMKIGPFEIPQNFIIETKILFLCEYSEMRQIYSLSSESQILRLYLFKNKIILSIQDKKRKEDQIQLAYNIKINEFMKITLKMATTTVTFSLNDKVQTYAKLPNKFIFKSPQVIFKINNFNLETEYIYIYSKEDEFYISKSSSIQNNTNAVNSVFTGITVPFSTSIFDAISVSGGPQIFLPLFHLIPQNSKSSEFFICLIELIQTIIKNNEQPFENLQFFRALGHLLLVNKSNYLNSYCIEKLYLMYQQINSQVLRKEMLQHIFGNFSLWTKIDEENQILVFSCIFSSLLEIDKLLFTEVLQFRSVLIKFVSIFENNPSSIELIQKCWNFLMLLSAAKFSEKDSELLISSALKLSHDNMVVNSIKLIINLISDNSEVLMSYLENIGLYSIFIEILNSRFEKTRIISLNSMYYILSVINFFKHQSDLSVELVNSIRLYNINDNTILTIINIMNYIFNSFNFKDFPHICKSFDFDGEVQIVKNPEFLPIFSHLITFSNDETKIQFCNYLRTSFNKYEESRVNCFKCKHWISWLIFLINCDKKQNEWIQTIKSIILTGKTIIDDIYELLYICNIFEIPILSTIIDILKDAIVKEYDTSEKTIFLLIQFLFYKVYEEKFTVKFDDSVHNFSQRIVLQKEFKFNLYFSLEMNSIDLQVLILVTRHLIFKPFDFYARKSSLIDTINNFTLICYFIRIISLKYPADASNLVQSLLNILIDKRHNLSSYFINGILILLSVYFDDINYNKDLFCILSYADQHYNHCNNTLNSMRLLVKEKVDEVSKELQDFVPKIEASLLNNVTEIRNDLFKIFNMVFLEYLDKNQKLCEIRTLLFSEVSQLEQEMSRIQRSDAQHWKRVNKRLHNQNGGPWCTIPDAPHYKFSDVLDSFGRRNKFKVNNHFDNHKDASILRDTGIETESKTVKRTNIEYNCDFESLNSYSLELECQMVTVTKYFKGTMFISKLGVYFEAKQTTDAFGDLLDKTSKHIEIPLYDIKFIIKRRYLHIDTAAEIFTIYDRSYFFIFTSLSQRKMFFKEIQSLKPENLQFIIQKDVQQKFISKLQAKWSTGEMSNFEYLFWLNVLSGRSIHDLSQYPVYPWVICDYERDKIDFYDNSIYRDLSKPIGALNNDRLQTLQKLYKDSSEDDPFLCLYRFHYSAPAYVISYLIRKEPFTTLHIQLQKGKFDYPNRLFYSISSTWNSVLSSSNDFRELIPEFYSTPEFLINSDQYDLGYIKKSETDIKKKVDDVELPKWAKTHAEYITINKIALESIYVSEHLHEWINLIFGYKQNSIEYNNKFHPYSYSSSIEDDPNMIPIIQQHAANFGIVPDLLFTSPHPMRQYKPPYSSLIRNSTKIFKYKKLFNFSRNALKIYPLNYGMNILLNDGTLANLSFHEDNNIIITKVQKIMIQSQIPLNRILALTTPERTDSYTIISEPWAHTFTLITKDKIFKPKKQHSSAISVIVADGDYCVTGSDDSSIIVWNLKKEKAQSLIVAHMYPISILSVSSILQVVLSCDNDGNVVLSSLKTGSFLQKYKIDKLPKLALMSSLGFCIFIYEEANSTRITLHDMNGRKLEEVVIEGKCTASCIMENSDSTSYIAIALDNEFVYIFRIYDLYEIFCTKVDGIIREMAYYNYSLYFIANNVTLCNARFDY